MTTRFDGVQIGLLVTDSDACNGALTPYKVYVALIPYRLPRVGSAMVKVRVLIGHVEDQEGYEVMVPRRLIFVNVLRDVGQYGP
jgi:hypothetical protein